MTDRHQRMIRDAAALLIAVADDSGESLVDAIKELERYIIQETKVGDARTKPMPPGRRGYTLVAGHIVEIAPLVEAPTDAA